MARAAKERKPAAPSSSRLTIHELAATTSPPTPIARIRANVAAGWMRGAHGTGRGAWWDAEHVEELRRLEAERPHGYTISTVVERSGFSRRTLKEYRRGKIIQPIGYGKGTRYTDEDLRWLAEVRRIKDGRITDADLAERLRRKEEEEAGQRSAIEAARKARFNTPPPPSTLLSRDDYDRLILRWGAFPDAVRRERAASCQAHGHRWAETPGATGRRVCRGCLQQD